MFTTRKERLKKDYLECNIEEYHHQVELQKKRLEDAKGTEDEREEQWVLNMWQFALYSLEGVQKEFKTIDRYGEFAKKTRCIMK